MKTSVAATVFVLTAILLLGDAVADPVHDGNELALKFSGAAPAVKKQLQSDETGIIHVFRYLKVTGIKTNAPADGMLTLQTIEPSSDMRVDLMVGGSARLSMELAATLVTGECVAAQGRIKTLGTEKPNLLVVEQAVLLHKDRFQPKPGAELLHEVDPNAVQ